MSRPVPRRGALSAAIGALLALAASAAHAGAYTFAGASNPDIITHPAGYTGSATPSLTLDVCIDTAVLPTGATATQFENTVQKVVATWNARRASAQNLGTGSNNDLPSNQVDLESALLHESGHCLGLAHPNLATESGLNDPQRNATKSTSGTDATFDTDAGPDGDHGSRDDVRGDDVNLYWFRKGSNDPLAFPSVIDGTTYSRVLTDLPVTGGHLHAANADRSVLADLGYADTESAMQQGQGFDEAQRRPTAEDVAALRLAQSGFNEIQGDADDYTITLNYVGRTTDCDIVAKFDPGTSFAACSVSGTVFGGANTGHARINSATLSFSSTAAWYFSEAFNTTTTITADGTDPSPVGSTYPVTVTVAKVLATPAGTPDGNVEIVDELGNACTATLAAGSASCSLPGSAIGTRVLTAHYLGRRGFDASASATTTHAIAAATPTVTITSDTPATTVVGQSYTVSVSVAGSVGTPTGTVTVSDGSASCNLTLSSGNGSCALASNSAGTKTLTATYAGNTSYDAASDTESHPVNAAATTTTIVSDAPDASAAGQAITVGYTVAVQAPGGGTPAGTVTVTAGSGEQCSAALPAASCDLVLGTVGPITLTATYAGSANHAGSSDTEAHTVGKATPTVTITSDDPASSAVGQGYAVAATVAGGAGTPSGTVTVGDGAGGTCTITLAGGAGTCMLASSAAGTRTLTATYAGNASYLAASDTEPHTVTAAETMLAITAATPDPSLLGTPVAVTVALTVRSPGSGTPSGTVTVAASSNAGQCTIVLPATGCALVLNAAGPLTLTASYPGDANFGPSSDTEAHTVSSLFAIYRDGFESD